MVYRVTCRFNVWVPAERQVKVRFPFLSKVTQDTFHRLSPSPRKRLVAYRCFAGSQTVRLAPLTLLVGDNNTGKTSLMAMLRAMVDITYLNRVPDFKEPPYDLGSFSEIIHRSGARGGPPEQFGAVMELAIRKRAAKADAVATHVDFGDYLSAPVPTRRRVSQGQFWIEQKGSVKVMGPTSSTAVPV